MADHLAVFKSSRRKTFNLGNLIDNTCTAPLNVILTAIFSLDNHDVDSGNTRQPGDLILSIISAEKFASTNSLRAFILPSECASHSNTISSNVKKALIARPACVQAIENCW